MRLFKSKTEKELDNIIKRLEMNMSNNYKDSAQDNLKEFEATLNAMHATGCLKDKVLSKYESLLEHYKENMKGQIPNSSDGGLLATMNIGTNEKGNVTGFILAHPSKDSPDAVIVVSEYMFSAMLKKIIPQLGDDSEQEVKNMFSRSTPFKTDYEYENNTTLETAETADYYIGIKHGFLGEGYYCELHVEDRDTGDYLMSLQ